jgi:ABC-type multidrug transport system fused ATPase/permease subunit
VRVDLYRHLISSSPGSFPRHSVGDLLAHIGDDTAQVEYLIYSGPLGVVFNVVSALLLGGLLLALSWKLTLCALLVVPALTFVSLRFSKDVRRAARVARRQATAWLSLAEERLGATPVVHAFGAAQAETDRFAASNTVARSAELRAVAIQARLTLLIEVVGALGGLLVLGVGAYEAHRGNLTVGSLIAFLGSVGSLYGPIRSLAKASSRFQRAAAGAQRVADLLDTPSLVVERPGAKSLKQIRGSLEFRDVHYAYPGGTDVLKGVAFRVEPGETVAVVGPNGSGKSTLVRLALRLADPTRGAVLLDGVDMRELTLESVRRAIAAVFQEPYILRGTLADNIGYNRPAMSEAELVTSARASHVEGFARALPGRYAAPVGARGGRLSGGQRQRLALARAFLRDAPVLVLDEAMASVDSETEELIQDAVWRLGRNRTVLLIGHRLSSVSKADRVVVLDQGRVVETGTPDGLLSRDSRFREFFGAQLMENTPA